MRMLLISGDFPPNRTGDANHAFFLAQHLSRRGVQVRVLTSRLEEVRRLPGVRVYPAMRRWTWSTLPELARWLNAWKPDAVLMLFDQLGRMYGFHPMMTFAPSLAKRLLPAVKFVTQFETVRGIDPGRKFPRSTRLIWQAANRVSGLGGGYHPYGTLLRDSDHIIVLSEAHRAELAREFPDLGEKSSLVPPPPIMTFCEDEGTARARGRALLGVRPEEFLFAFFGYVYRDKGIETLLRAFRKVAGSQPEVKLVIVGGYSQDQMNRGGTYSNQQYWEEMQRLSRELGVADQVLWTGTCSPMEERSSWYLRAADVCVLPLNSGLHLNNSSFAAAATHGLPVIGTQAKTTEAQFVDGENVWLCPPCDPEALAAAMAATSRDPAMRDRLRGGVRALAREWFSWDRAIDRTLRAFTG